MRLSVSKSKNSTSLYVKKDITVNGKRTSRIVEKLGTLPEIIEREKCDDPYLWAKEYIAKLNEEEKLATREVIVRYSQAKQMPKDKQTSFNGGYLFLDKIYNELKLPKICSDISAKYKFKYDLNNILSRIVFSRILFPMSKKSTYESCKNFLEEPMFDLHQIYRSLDVLAKEMDFIQASLYKNSNKVIDRDSKVLYYDCTNFFFESDYTSELKKYSVSKEHRPNPIVQMGLFMDKNGMPLAFDISSGNKNEQETLKPLEKKILKDFSLSKFVVCTDAGLSSKNNREFNTLGGRAFITTQSIKKLKKHLKDWALSPDGFSLAGSDEIFNINDINEEKYKDAIFYKERWINENALEQKLIITFSFKYKAYMERVRNSQVDRAIKDIETGNIRKKKNSNDYHRFIKTSKVTADGEVADKDIHALDESLIETESMYDGFYAVCTNLEDDAASIAKINKNRWEIEECFRIMKTDFKARPVYLGNDERIKAHFLTCFIALLIYRILEKRLDNKYTTDKIISELKAMNFYKVKDDGFIPTYTRSDFTDDLHDVSGFRTDYEIISSRNMKKILKRVKK